MILTCVVVGMLYFMIQGGDPFQITERMLSIADPSGRDYMSDAIYGLISGMVIYGSYGLYRPDDINILAGLAVGVTVLPAFVNAGIMFGAGLKGYKNRYKKNMTYYGMTSMFVGFIYLATITLGILTAKIVNEEYIKLTKKGLKN